MQAGRIHRTPALRTKFRTAPAIGRRVAGKRGCSADTRREDSCLQLPGDILAHGAGQNLAVVHGQLAAEIDLVDDDEAETGKEDDDAQ